MHWFICDSIKDIDYYHQSGSDPLLDGQPIPWTSVSNKLDSHCFFLLLIVFLDPFDLFLVMPFQDLSNYVSDYNILKTDKKDGLHI